MACCPSERANASSLGQASVPSVIHPPTHPTRPNKQATKKDTVLDLNKYLDKAVRVRFQGGREGKREKRLLRVHAFTHPQPLHPPI